MLSFCSVLLLLLCAGKQFKFTLQMFLYKMAQWQMIERCLLVAGVSVTSCSWRTASVITHRLMWWVFVCGECVKPVCVFVCVWVALPWPGAPQGHASNLYKTGGEEFSHPCVCACTGLKKEEKLWITNVWLFILQNIPCLNLSTTLLNSFAWQVIKALVKNPVFTEISL